MPDLYSFLLLNLGTIATGIASLLAVAALFWLRRHFVTWKAYDTRQATIDRRFAEQDKRFAEHDVRLTRQGARIAAVEGVTGTITDALAKLPQREDLLALEVGLAEMRGGLREVNANIQGLHALVERQESQTLLLQQHVLDLGK